jgi:hypothetical protein
LLAILLVAPHLPTPTSEAQLRAHAYATHLVWFTIATMLCATIAGWWSISRRAMAFSIVGAFAMVVVTIGLDVDALSDIAKIWFGALAGAAFVRAIERPWWMLPIVICVPLADAWSVFSSRGVTNAVIKRAQDEPRWIEWPTIASPIAGVPYELFGRIGTVDVLFLTLFLAVATRWKLGIRRTVVALVIGLVATTVFVFELDDIAIPALPMLCLAFLAACAPSLVRDLRSAMQQGPPSNPSPR